jgi:metal iron transporter
MQWATDLEAGSTFGYAHLFVILSASIMAIILQVLATRLGYITGKGASHTASDYVYHTVPDSSNSNRD